MTSARSAPRLDTVFAAQVAERPDALAVHDRGTTLSYAGLDAAAQQIAGLLGEHGCIPGTLVGLRMGRGRGTIAAILGIWKHGCGYVPIDPGYPSARQEFVINDAGLRLILAEGPDSARPVRVERRDVPSRSVPGETACVIYTSGSTGTPKGVITGHPSAVAFLDAATREAYGVRPDDICTWFHSISFDYSVWEMWGALTSGAQVLVVPAELTTQPDRFLSLLTDRAVTVLCQTPTVFGHLVRAVQDGGGSLPALRQVILAGEPLDVPSILQWAASGCAPAALLYNLYGLTETTVGLTGKLLDLDELALPASGSSIGRPMPHALIALVEDGRRVPPGTPGEIWATGDCLAFGYLERPELNKERFLYQGLDGEPPRRWYRTGDYALLREDGELEFLGRRDAQIKLRGYRIELGEIESVLSRLPTVRQAAVVTAPGRTGDLQLVACYVPDRPGHDLAKDLQEALSRELPAYMVPARFLKLAELPQSFAGKLDRRSLTRIAQSSARD